MKKNKKETAEKRRIQIENAIYRTCFKTTSDYWAPSYRMSNGQMLVCVTLNTTITDHVNVSVWGLDDSGAQKFFTLDQKEEAIKLYNSILDLPNVDRKKLRELEMDIY